MFFSLSFVNMNSVHCANEVICQMSTCNSADSVIGSQHEIATMNERYKTRTIFIAVKDNSIQYLKLNQIAMA